jgi:uncharacterized integral membrane protein
LHYLNQAISILLFCFVSFVAFTNMQSQPINLFGSSQSLPEGLLAIIGLIAGIVSVLIWPRKLKPLITEAKQQEWQAQDVKLAAEIKSDREKQLESKIATLETALKAALKKN